MNLLEVMFCILRSIQFPNRHRQIFTEYLKREITFSLLTAVHVGNDGGKLVRIFVLASEIDFQALACLFLGATAADGLLSIGRGNERAIVCLHIEITSLH